MKKFFKNHNEKNKQKRLWVRTENSLPHYYLKLEFDLKKGGLNIKRC